MAQKVTITMVDDLDGVSEAAETVPFALAGTAYEIDLSPGHAAELRAAFAPFAAAGRKVRIFRNAMREITGESWLDDVARASLSAADAKSGLPAGRGRTVVVRGFGYVITHVATVPRSAFEPMAWPGPQHTFTGVRTPVVARCGNRVRSSQDAVVVMRPGTGVGCRRCARITGIERQPAESDAAS